MSFHSYGPTCPGCETKLSGVHPYLQNWFRTKVKPEHPEAHIACAWRDQADQERAFLDGKSEEHWPHSKHNHMDGEKPCSLALDLFLLDEDNIGSWPPGFYAGLNRENEEAGEPLVWGGSWKTIKDSDHFELDLEKLLGPRVA